MNLSEKIAGQSLTSLIRPECRDAAFTEAINVTILITPDLREVGGWHLHDGMIRTGEEHELCPITAVCQHRGKGTFPVEKAGAAARAVGIDLAAAMVLAESADSTIMTRPTVRKALLRATGIGR